MKLYCNLINPYSTEILSFVLLLLNKKEISVVLFPYLNCFCCYLEF